MKKRIASAVFTALFLLMTVVIVIILIKGPVKEKLYPHEYSEFVEKYSKENQIPQELVYAVIHTESRFIPNAQSNVGARGLMQLTEETFDWVKGKLHDTEEITFDTMYDPETNIKYGTYLLGYLYDEFGNVENTLCAYHAGRSSVNSWLLNKEYSLNGVVLDKIPYKDTAHYVDKVEKAIKIYEKN